MLSHLLDIASHSYLLGSNSYEIFSRRILSPVAEGIDGYPKYIYKEAYLLQAHLEGYYD